MGKLTASTQTDDLSWSHLSKMTVISQLLIQKNMGLKVLVTVSSESIGVYFFQSQNQGVLGFCTLWLQQELGLIGTKLFFVTWKRSFVSVEQRRALSPNLTCAHLWKCGTRGPGPSGHKSLICGLQSVFSRMNSSEAWCWGPLWAITDLLLAESHIQPVSQR